MPWPMAYSLGYAMPWPTRCHAMAYSLGYPPRRGSEGGKGARCNPEYSVPEQRSWGLGATPPRPIESSGEYSVPVAANTAYQ